VDCLDRREAAQLVQDRHRDEIAGVQDQVGALQLAETLGR
jgi:hypothetical protein